MLPEVPARGGRWDATPPVLGPSILVPSGTVRGQREVGGVSNAVAAAPPPKFEQGAKQDVHAAFRAVQVHVPEG